MVTEAEDWLDRAIDDFLADQKRRELRKENPWALYLIKVLWPYPNGRTRMDAIDAIRKLRTGAGLSTPAAFDNTVQSVYNGHNGLSSVFKRRNAPPEDDLFYPVGGPGSGRWAVNREKAKAWVLRRNIALD